MSFRFNNISSDSFDFELDLKSSDHLNKSAKNYESISIPGRSEKLIMDIGLKESKTITNILYLQAPNGLKEAIDYIDDWIQGELGYNLLEYSDGSRFNAICKDGIKVEELYDNVAQITIVYEASEVE